jgi:NAD(P)-dependent dehydrogenase (short-subunit alcohol dehydrogenase family)
LVTMLDPLLRASGDGRAVILTEDIVGRPFYAGLGAAKAAQAAIAASWHAETARTSVKVVLHTPDAAPTAHRARAFPGEDRETLPDIQRTAEAVLDQFTA